jgi:hypothetical protein
MHNLLTQTYPPQPINIIMGSIMVKHPVTSSSCPAHKITLGLVMHDVPFFWTAHLKNTRNDATKSVALRSWNLLRAVTETHPEASQLLSSRLHGFADVDKHVQVLHSRSSTQQKFLGIQQATGG